MTLLLAKLRGADNLIIYATGNSNAMGLVGVWLLKSSGNLRHTYAGK
jgi:hypothetical protein